MKDRGLVLIADDDSLLCRTIASALRRRGYRTLAARDGREAVILAERRKPVVIIVDFMMPVMDGLETARAIKSNPDTHAIPIVLLTTAGNSDVERLASGGDAWWSARLEKPITMQTLVRTIDTVTASAEVGTHDANATAHGNATRAYLQYTLERLDDVRLAMEAGRPAAAARKACEIGLRHARRIRDGASAMQSTRLKQLAMEAESLLERVQVEGGLDEGGRGRLHVLVKHMAAAMGLSSDGGPAARTGSTSAGDATGRTKVPWLLLVCDDPEFAIAVASRARFYGLCVNHVAQPGLAAGIARRYPFAAIAVAGTAANDAAALVDELRRVSPRVPIVVSGAGRADAHRAALKAGADRILPSGVEPERLIVATSEMVHHGKPALGTVLTIAEDPAVIGMIESQLIDLGCNVVSIPSLTALSETVDVVEPDILLADIGDSSDVYIDVISVLRSQPRWADLPVVGIARDAGMAQSLAGRKDVADAIVVRSRLADQIRRSVFDIMRARRSLPGIELDPTTGALGREAFLVRGSALLERSVTAGSSPVLAGVEVDTRALESRIGEGAADLMLKAVYQRVREIFSDRDATIGRLDGGYFALLIGDGDPDEVRRELAVAASVFTPSVQIRTGACATTADASFKQLLAQSINAVQSIEPTPQANRTEHEPASEPHTAEISVVPNDGADSRSVYIVEDDGVLRTVLTEQLSKAGFDCHGYSDGSEALAALLEAENAGDAPVVLLDLDLPGMDGWNVLERLRAERPDMFRTVIMTASEDEETEVKGLQAGASDFIVKPIKVPVMVERIRRLVA